MTEIKKFGFGVVAAALFAAMAFATLVSTVGAAPSNIAAAPSIVAEPGDAVTISVDISTDSDVTFLVAPGSTADATWEEDDTTSFTCGITDANTGDDFDCDDGAATVDIIGNDTGPITATLNIDDDSANGQVNVVVTQDNVSETITIFVVADTTAGDLDAIELVSAPASLIEDGDAAADSDDWGRIRVNAVDEDGDGIGNVDVTVRVNDGLLRTDGGGNCSTDAAHAFDDDECIATSSNTSSTRGRVDVNVIADEEAGENVRVTLFNVDNAPVVTEVTIPIAGEADSLTIEAPATAARGSVSSVTVSVVDENGTPVADGTDVEVAVSGGVISCPGDDVTTDGELECNFVAPGADQTVVITAISGDAIGTANVTVSGTTPTDPGEPGDGGFAAAPTFGANGVGSAVFNGGTIEQLAAATTAAGGTGVWAQGSDGNWYRYSTGATGATAFVNNAFNTQFAGGFALPTAVFVVQ